MEGPGDACIVLKTRLGLEKIVANRVKELFHYLEVSPSPKGFQGLVLVKNCREPVNELEKILVNVIEVENGYRILYSTPADIKKIVSVSQNIAKLIKPGQCFAVRTVRRGRHDFTSLDVNVAVGAAIKESTGACVNLDSPDVVIGVEIIDDEAFITLYPGSSIKKKYVGKKLLPRMMSKISAIQMPYFSPDPEATKRMGIRIGREVQNFEVKELVIAFDKPVDAFQLRDFIDGVEEGIESRYRIQVKSYGRRARKVPVRVYDIFQLVRTRYNEPIIVLEPEGRFVSDVKDELLRLFKKHKRINLLAGSREGIPSGIYRVADAVIDIAPGITLSTEYALAAGLIAISTILYEWVDEIGGESDHTGSR
ncbi:MAG: SPOUT family RNA methylase [Desulfurococcales archaeon]|nr:SPOUT family RNA methylase [Desulfurococcales archaeon]